MSIGQPLVTTLANSNRKILVKYLQRLTIKKINLKLKFTISLTQKKIQDENYFVTISSNPKNSVSSGPPTLRVCSTPHFFILIGGDTAQVACSHPFPFRQARPSPTLLAQTSITPLQEAPRKIGDKSING